MIFKKFITMSINFLIETYIFYLLKKNLHLGLIGKNKIRLLFGGANIIRLNIIDLKIKPKLL